MKTEEKRMICILLIILVVTIVGLTMWRNSKNKEQQNGEEQVQEEKYVQILEDGTKLNISEKLKETKTIEGIEITNIQLTEQGGQTMLLAQATNKKTVDSPVMGINIIVVDKTGKEIGKIPGVVSPLKAGETKQLNINTQDDYANAYDFKVEKQ